MRAGWIAALGALALAACDTTVTTYYMTPINGPMAKVMVTQAPGAPGRDGLPPPRMNNRLYVANEDASERAILGPGDKFVYNTGFTIAAGQKTKFEVENELFYGEAAETACSLYFSFTPKPDAVYEFRARYEQMTCAVVDIRDLATGKPPADLQQHVLW